MAAAAVLGRSEAGRANRARWGPRNPLGPEGGKPESRGKPAGETRRFGWKGAHPWIAFSAPWGPGNPNPTRAGVPAAGDGDSKEMVPWLLFPGYHPPHPQWLSPESYLGVRRSPPLSIHSLEGWSLERVPAQLWASPVTMATRQLAHDWVGSPCLSPPPNQYTKDSGEPPSASGEMGMRSSGHSGGRVVAHPGFPSPAPPRSPAPASSGGVS